MLEMQYMNNQNQSRPQTQQFGFYNKNNIFYAKTAQNFYNMSKGYYRPNTLNKKRKKVDIARS